MKARILKCEAAKRDLVAQWVWYAEKAGIETADRFLAAVDAALATLARHPECGSRTFFSKPDLKRMRRFPVTDGFERVVLFYFQRQNGIELVRVVHGSRDLQALAVEGFFG